MTTCKYFLQGYCYKGETCPFVHPGKGESDDTRSKTSDITVCPYYLKGFCQDGSNCKYEHISKASLEASELQSRQLPKKNLMLPNPILPTDITDQSESMMTKLRKVPRLKEDCVSAPVFKPSFLQGHSGPSSYHQPPTNVWNPLSYSDVTRVNADFEQEVGFVDEMTAEEARMILCPFASKGMCPFGEECVYLHGLVCDTCGRQCLHPFDDEQQKRHKKECVHYHEKEMEYSFAMQRSEGKKCCICMEVVLEKAKPSDCRFGILSECNHVFCLACIREWRSTSNQDKKTVRTCPICRKCSYFVIPSMTWVEDRAEKHSLIEQYRSNLKAKPCTYFKRGDGVCPFGNSCFYLHAYPDGAQAEVSYRKAQTADGDVKAIRETKLVTLQS
jgi:E3 ubiquitin-protein ligase makorin